MKSGTRVRLEAINALAELERVGWGYKPLSETEVRIRCPAHEDATPSCSLNVEKREWHCHAAQCGKSGDIVTALALIAGVDRTTILVDLATRYDVLEQGKSIDPTVVEKFAGRLSEAGPLLKALRDRGLTDEMMRSARLGYHEGRITIPIWDEMGRVVNIRRYLPGAPGHLKMQNTRGHGAPRIYRVKDLVEKSRVWLCGGEMKAIVAGFMLAQTPELSCGAISVTAGEGTWNHAWDGMLREKELLICMDVDEAGLKASQRLARGLARVAKSVRIVRLPLDVKKHPKGDINDWVGAEGATAADFARLTLESPVYQLEEIGEGPEAPVEPVELQHATEPSNIKRRLEVEGVVVALEQTPYLVPHEVRVQCTRDQPSCGSCPVQLLEPNPDDGFADMAVPATSEAVLELVDSPRSQQRGAIMNALGIPPCKVVTFGIKSHHVGRDVRLAPQLTMRSEGGANVVQPAMVVGATVDLMVPYVFRGRLHAHPKTHQATLVLNEARETQDSLASFDPSDSELTELSVFCPKSWSPADIEAKLASNADDLAHNVTGIMCRPDLHRIIDVAFFSPLQIKLGDRQSNGWANVLIIGDSAQGKTEATTRMMEHYGLGERVECKNASVAGLLGGLQQMGKGWFVSWGVIPTHDRRLVVLEEVKGAPVEVIAKLTDMRSSGIAEIPKIERRRAHARTRLVFVSNPRSPRPMAAFGFGIEAVMELIGSLEDVRRFDACVALAAGAVQVRDVDAERARRVPSTNTAELCRRLVMWTWTRAVEDVHFEPEADADTLPMAMRLCERFTDAIPLIDKGTTRLKLARTAAAFAARTFSTGGHLRSLLVRRSHVQVAFDWITRIYSDPAMGYLQFTKARERVNTITDAPGVTRYLESTRHPRALVAQLLHHDVIALQDLQDLCELDRDAAQKVLSFLVINHCLVRDGRQGYAKTPDFIDLLRGMRDVAPAGDQGPRQEERF